MQAPSIEELREKVAKTLLENESEYLPFMIEDDGQPMSQGYKERRDGVRVIDKGWGGGEGGR